MKTTAIELRTLVLNDLDGNPVAFPENDIAKAFGNALFVNNPTIEIEAMSRLIHAGEEIQASEGDLMYMAHVNLKLAGYSRFLKNGINEYLTNKVELLKEEENGNK